MLDTGFRPIWKKRKGAFVQKEESKGGKKNNLALQQGLTYTLIVQSFKVSPYILRFQTELVSWTGLPDRGPERKKVRICR